jgi:hypothetical protein
MLAWECAAPAAAACRARALSRQRQPAAGTRRGAWLRPGGAGAGVGALGTHENDRLLYTRDAARAFVGSRAPPQLPRASARSSAVAAADARVPEAKTAAAVGFGARGAALADALAAGGVLPAGSCTVLTGEEQASRAFALSMRTRAGCVLVGAADAGSAATAETARSLKAAGVSVCAVLASPFGFEGTRKAAQASEFIQALAAAVGLLVVVDQERLTQNTGTTLAQATLAADSVLRDATQSICGLLCCELHIVLSADVAGGSPTVVRGPFMQQLRLLKAFTAPASYGSGAAPLAADASDTAAAAAVTVAAFSAAATPFLAHVRGTPASGCVCLVRAAVPLSTSVLEAAAQAIVSLLPGCPLQLSFVHDTSVARDLHVDMFVVSAVAPANDAVAVKEPIVRDARTQRNWNAMAGLAGGTTPRAADGARATRASPAPQQQVLPPSTLMQPAARDVGAVAPPFVAAPVSAATAAELQPSAGPWTGSAEVEPRAAAQAQASRPFWRLLGRPRRQEQSVSQRASAALANDRAASRTVVRLDYPDGSSYEGEMLDGREHGKGRRVYANGSWFAGEWQDGLRHGWGVSQTGNERYEGQWAFGVPVDDKDE